MAQFWPARPPQAGYVASVSNTTAQLINFPAPFGAPPIVVATIVQSRLPLTVQDITTTGFKCIVEGTIPRAVNWVALPAS
ncbi:hypothetical protein GCM10022239_03300 [Leifsonia bigeumensis]|uniref:Ig-like domain-containing protein n=1 Tax=Leifsonella bigeumensis TaxID=433643 RepID=A0ABP7F387_9MICO